MAQTKKLEAALMAGVGSLIPEMKHSLAVNHRKIFLCDFVTDSSVFECIYYLNKLADLDMGDEKLPIEILVNSYGGGAYEGFALINLIEEMKDNGYKIITTNLGKAMSMGLPISVCGTERRAYRHSSYMYHDVSSMNDGKAQEMIEDVNESIRIRDMMNDILFKYTKVTKEELEFFIERKQNKFWSAEEALKLGFTDKIL